MVATKIIAGENQDLWDIAIQRYGSIEAAPLVLEENPALGGYNAVATPGAELVAVYRPLNEQVVNTLALRRVKPANALVVTRPPARRGSFTKSFNLSFN